MSGGYHEGRPAGWEGRGGSERACFLTEEQQDGLRVPYLERLGSEGLRFWNICGSLISCLGGGTQV